MRMDRQMRNMLWLMAALALLLLGGRASAAVGLGVRVALGVRVGPAGEVAGGEMAGGGGEVAGGETAGGDMPWAGALVSRASGIITASQHAKLATGPPESQHLAGRGRCWSRGRLVGQCGHAGLHDGAKP
jgi:hypothetical protein